MFRAMIQHDAGDPSAALRDLLGVLATESTDADVTRYRRALGAYAQILGEPQA
jgi:cyanophycin synthetase